MIGTSGSQKIRSGAVSLNRTRLLSAIQILDGEEQKSDDRCSDKIHNKATSVARTCSALRFLLEITFLLDQDSATKDEVITVLEARVLRCLHRFVEKHNLVLNSSIGVGCEGKCQERLIRLAVVTLLYYTCREPRMASSIVKEKLHSFLLEVCLPPVLPSQTCSDSTVSPCSPSCTDIKKIDPRDLMIAIDPFDWCYQSICSHLVNEQCEIFLVPCGARTLVYLLAGEAIPTDEITDHEKSERCLQTLKDKSRRKLAKIAQSPSIFTFQTKVQHEGASQQRQRKLCRRVRSDAEDVYKVVLSDLAITHLALRALVVLALHLRHPSTERKELFGYGGGRLVSVFASMQSTDIINSYSIAPIVGIPMYQTTALYSTIFRQMALAGLALVHVHEKPLRCIDHSSAASDRAISTRTKGKREPSASKNLGNRLRTATEDAKRELRTTSSAVQLQNALEIESSRRRHILREACTRLESTREHLDSGLAVLFTGRVHPNANQTFREWIDSLPTMEKLEQERQYQEQMRHRRILELQYQQEERRRRERRENTIMEVNDYDVPNVQERTVHEERRLQFLAMQKDAHQLEQEQLQLVPAQNISSHISDDEAARRASIERIMHQQQQERENEENKRLQWLADRKRAAKELHQMAKEDLYYVEKIIRAKQHQQQQLHEAQRAKSKQAVVNSIEEQQRKIQHMRLLDQEKKRVDNELDAMSLEDLFGRQQRLIDAEKRKLMVQNEWRARKAMEYEERICRSMWIKIDQERVKHEQAELKRQRIEARQLRRQQKREKEQVLAAWVQGWDEYGNTYYYNQVTGISQWENPFS